MGICSTTVSITCVWGSNATDAKFCTGFGCGVRTGNNNLFIDGKALFKKEMIMVVQYERKG
jgi:hypothetical protein